MKTVWKALAWIFALCGIGAYLLAWGDIWIGKKPWGAGPEALFADAIATGIFALFFLAWGALSARG
jgi:hypothetical protein